ncbi:MAG: WxcM-like domain-containing protein [Lachnospiraceae bacterium]|nr:WxcM-like domain-containing protein [Lachnospiraceae bacterium]
MSENNCCNCFRQKPGNTIRIAINLQQLFVDTYGSDNEVIRGKHANLKSEFVMINVSGTSKVKVDNGQESRIIELDRPRIGLYLKSMVWKEMYEFSPDSVLLVLSNEHYDPKEYIRNYDDYLKMVKK